ncbi:MAG: YfiR family protein [Nitrosomonas sp.]|nr:YfiR family protein [Nitrosomonas sp.]
MANADMNFFNRFIQPLSMRLKRGVVHAVCVVCLGFVLPYAQSDAFAEEIIEYKVKAAFIYNFLIFTQWPEETGETLNLCIYGRDYFDGEIDLLESKPVNGRQIQVKRISVTDQFNDCQAIFFSKSISNELSTLLDKISDKPILTLADSSTAVTHGVAINMDLSNERIIFEINLRNARDAGLNISSRLLQLAVKVHQ